MNSYAIVFTALIAVAAAGSISRSTGWGAPANPQIELALDGALAASGEGAADANQQLAASASGDAHNPATIVAVNGISAFVGESGEIAQIATANLPSGSTATAQNVNVDQLVAGNDYAAVDANGANSASVAISAGSDATGSGDAAVAAATVNEVIHR